VAREVENERQREELQNAINRWVEWSTEWQMLFMVMVSWCTGS
jgi:hypothetical protein